MEDKVYALPIDTNIWAMMYNKDLFAEAGLPELGPDDVITYDDWLVYARAINKPADTLEERVWGSAFFEPAWNSMGNYMSDPYILGDDGRTCLGNAETDDWLHFWEIALTAYDEDLTTQTAGALLADVEEDMFTQGKLGMTYAALGDAIYAKQNGINVGLTGQPVVSDGWDGNVGGWNGDYSILAATEHPEEAWQFLKWLSTEAPKIVPLGTDALDAGAGSGLPGLPCYLPLLEYGEIADMVESEALVADGVKLMRRVKAPPFTVDLWGSVDPFSEAFRRITEDREDIAVAVGDAAQECQDITDELWEGWDALSE
jgi:ABC-type glycerol-3-phosphate transport system substrate-binding protein